MARISGVDLPGRKHISIALRYLYGVGPTRAVEICEKAQIPLDVLRDTIAQFPTFSEALITAVRELDV